jgi:hypothetical protein
LPQRCSRLRPLTTRCGHSPHAANIISISIAGACICFGRAGSGSKLVRSFSSPKGFSCSALLSTRPLGGCDERAVCRWLSSAISCGTILSTVDAVGAHTALSRFGRARFRSDSDPLESGQTVVLSNDQWATQTGRGCRREHVCVRAGVRVCPAFSCACLCVCACGSAEGLGGVG